MAREIRQDLEFAKELFSDSEVCKAEKRKVENLIAKQNKNELVVAVIGQFKRGKSTLINALLEEEILPVGIVPVTSVVTKIEYGEKKIEVFFDRGNVEKIEACELSKYVNEQENKNNELGVLSIGMGSKADFLKEGLILVDTPGVGSFHKHNTEAAYSFVKESDGVIFLLSVDSPINEIEIEFLKNAKEFASKFYFVVNKIDNISGDELEQYLSYCNSLLTAILGSEEVNLIPISARHKTGIDNLKEKILYDLRKASTEILAESARMKLIDLINTAVSKIKLYTVLLELPAVKLSAKYDRLKAYSEELAQKNKDLLAELEIGDGEESAVDLAKRLSFELNDMKIGLGVKVKELFDIDYSFELEDMEVLKKYSLSNAKGNKEEVFTEFRQKESQTREELLEMLTTILMHQEKNTITITRNLEELNRIYRNLRALRVHLQNV